MMMARSRSAPTIEPTTIPAMAPPLRPPPPLLEPGAAVALELAMDEGDRAPMEVVTGSSTLSHRVSVFDAIQHESVEFGELLEQ
jgi:hypothetical protein